MLRNALRHTPVGSTIEITLQADKARQQIEQGVADHGPGIAPEALEAIFQPFYRGADATPGAGYGLGLAITRSIINAHGGKVWARLEPQGGLAVHLVLPYCR